MIGHEIFSFSIRPYWNGIFNNQDFPFPLKVLFHTNYYFIHTNYEHIIIISFYDLRKFNLFGLENSISACLFPERLFQFHLLHGRSISRAATIKRPKGKRSSHSCRRVCILLVISNQ